MNQNLLNDVLYLVGFCLFVVLQSLAINGIHYALQGGCINDFNKGKVCKGNMLYMIWPTFFERNRSKWWSSAAYSCIKCMSSCWGAITFWPVVVYLFGFHWVQVGVFLFDVPILCSLNFYIYKRL